MKSIWQDGVHLPSFPVLDKNIKADVLIIGGGMAGIMCAYMLGAAGVDYVLAEADTICCGITKNTTAKITVQHGLVYEKMLRRFGSDLTRMYLDANTAAAGKYRELCADIACGYETQDSYIYSINDRSKIEKELDALGRLGCNAVYADALPLPFKTAGAVRFFGQAQFNPLRFVASIVPGMKIFEHTAVRELKGMTAVTDRGIIRAERIIVATHFPFINKHGSYFLKMYQHRSYVLALDGAPTPDGMYADENDGGYSFRSYDGFLLFGGSGCRTGKKCGGWKALSDAAEKFYPSSNEKYRWATQDCMTLDGIPYIGKYSARTPCLYVATGFNKWGMTSSMVAAMLLCDMVREKDNPYAPVFSPSRTMLRPQLAANALEATVSLLSPVKKRCPHLGCALSWNSHEHTWDCPCHGSRFTADGRLIDNPATGGLGNNEKHSVNE